MAASSAPSIKAQLLTLLGNDAGLTGVRLDYADPGSDVAQEQIYFARTLQTEKPDSFGQRAQRESYDLEVYVGVSTDGNDAQAAEERCWALVARLETIIRVNNGAGGNLGVSLTGGGYVVMGAIEMIPFTDSGQRCAVAVCKVHVEARK